jgi:hypothetical protein
VLATGVLSYADELRRSSRGRDTGRPGITDVRGAFATGTNGQDDAEAHQPQEPGTPLKWPTTRLVTPAAVETALLGQRPVRRRRNPASTSDGFTATWPTSASKLAIGSG